MSRRNPKTSKVINRIKRDITNKKFDLGDKIDSVSNIAKKVGVSWKTARKGIRNLCACGLLEYNTGRFYVVGKPIIRISTAMRMLNIIDRAKANMTAAEMLQNGGIYDGKYIVILQKKRSRLTLFYPLNQKEYIFNIIDIYDTINNQISTKMLFNDNSLNNKYQLQNKIMDHIEVIKQHIELLS